MLASGNRAAYGALFREGLQLVAGPVDFVLRPFEKRRLSRVQENNQPLVLIVGAPRSGTTLVYQTLAHYLDVTHPPNISAVLKRSPITAARLQRRFGSSSTPRFENYYGQTSHLSGCNDAFSIWNRWLGEDRYQPRQTLTDDESADMRQFFNAWTNAFNKPFLNKNNRNAFATELLAEHLPQAKFVVVRRNPMFVAQSLIVARQRIQGNKQTAWGLESTHSSDSRDPLAYVDSVCRQIKTIDREMNRQLATIDSSRVFDMTYESFCETPQQMIAAIASKFDGLELNPAADLKGLQPFTVSAGLTLSPAEQQRIRQQLGQRSESEVLTQGS